MQLNQFIAMGLIWGASFSAVAAAAPKNMSAHLNALQIEYRAHLSSRKGKAFISSDRSVQLFKSQYVAVDISLKKKLKTAQINKLKKRLKKLGLSQITEYKQTLSGIIPIDKLSSLPKQQEISWISSSKATRRGFGAPGGAAYNAADAAMFTDAIRKQYQVDGSGITIGVLSDSYDCLGGAGTDVNSGDLPDDVRVLKEYPFCEDDATDEGRAMMQLIHDIAPGAKLVFYTAFVSPTDFAHGIQALADAGANVIVDDVGYLTMPFFQADPIAQSVNEVKARGVSYFSAAGNSARLSYEKAYTEGYGPFSFDRAHDFGKAAGGASDFYQKITLPPNQNIRITLQWDDPAEIVGGEGAKTDLDIFLLDQFKRRIITSSQDDNIGHNPIEFIGINHDSDALDYYLYISHRAGPAPKHIKYVIFGPTAPWPEASADQVIELNVAINNGVPSIVMSDGTALKDGKAVIVLSRDIKEVGTADLPILVGSNGKPLIKVGDRVAEIGPGSDYPLWFIPDGYSAALGPHGIELYREKEAFIPVSIDQYATYSSTIFGHPNADGAMAVGAMPYQQTPWFGESSTQGKIESFSSAGGTPILFDQSGIRLTEPVTRLKPDIVAPDDTDTTFFGSDTDLNGLPNFQGTSAAAPHAAAMASLLLSAYPYLTPDQVYGAMRQGSLDLQDPAQVEEAEPIYDDCGIHSVPDFATGCGLVQADLVFDNVKMAGDGVVLTVSPMEPNIKAGVEVNYLFRFSNFGSSDLQNVRLHPVDLPDYLLLQDMSGCLDDSAFPDDCSIGDVAAGESKTVILTATATNNPTGELFMDVETLSDTDADLSQAHLQATIPMHIGMGDLNHDGCVDKTDWGLLFGRFRAGGSALKEYDLNGDGKLGVGDLSMLEQAYSNPPSGDACR